MFTVFPKGLLSVLMFLSKSVFFEYQFQVSVSTISDNASLFQAGVILSAGMHDMCKIGKTAEGSSTSHPMYVTD